MRGWCLRWVTLVVLGLPLGACPKSPPPAPPPPPPRPSGPTGVGEVNLVAWCEAELDAMRRIFGVSQAALANAATTLELSPLPVNDAPAVRARLDHLSGTARACAICGDLDPCVHTPGPLIGAVGVRHLAAQVLALHNTAVANVDTDPRLPPAGPTLSQVYARACAECLRGDAPAPTPPPDRSGLVAACRAMRLSLESAATAANPGMALPPEMLPKNDCQELERCGIYAVAALPPDAGAAAWTLDASGVASLDTGHAGMDGGPSLAEAPQLLDALTWACAKEWTP